MLLFHVGNFRPPLLGNIRPPPTLGRNSSKKDYLKLHIIADVDNGLILHFTITGSARHDSPEFRRLVRPLRHLVKVMGDAAYNSRKNCKLVASMGGKPYLKTKSNATGRAGGSTEWKVSISEYSTDNDVWMAIYHLRSIMRASSDLSNDDGVQRFAEKEVGCDDAKWLSRFLRTT